MRPFALVVLVGEGVGGCCGGGAEGDVLWVGGDVGEDVEDGKGGVGEGALGC